MGGSTQKVIMKIISKIWNLLTHPKLIKFINLFIFISIIFDIWTDSVDLVTILLMMFIILDTLLDIRNNGVSHITLSFDLKDEDVKSKKTTKK